jgi:DNA-binding response OmpR family regulator
MARPNRSSESSGNLFSLLIVEDEHSLRQAMAHRFERRGHRVCAAASIAEARQQLCNASFDFFVFDIGLPDGDGLSLLDDGRAPRTLVISGEPQPARLEANGVEHFLAKPFDLSEATRRVEALSSSTCVEEVSQ